MPKGDQEAAGCHVFSRNAHSPPWQTARSQGRSSEAKTNQDALTCDAIDELCCSAA